MPATAVSPVSVIAIVPRLAAADVGRLAPLIADYAATMLGHDVAAIDAGQAEALIADPRVEVAGAEIDGELVGFALYYDLPEAISGRRAGQMDDLFVAASARGHGVAQALIAHLAEEGVRRGWVHLRWMAPEGSASARLYDRIAERAPWRSYQVRIDPTVSW